MSIFEAIVLGLVQGLTEFLPISSSAHLILVPWLLGWDTPGLAFDSALHLGTLAAVYCYFWRELLRMARALPRAVRRPLALLRVAAAGSPADHDARLALLIAVGTLPGLVVGLLAEGAIDDLFHGDDRSRLAIAAIALALMALGLLLYVAERIARHERPLDRLTLRDAVTIGAAQAAALMPGVSRSGATITAGLFQGLRRADAARFSFLLGTPLITGAGLKGLIDTFETGLGGSEGTAFAVGMLTSAAAGFAAIWALLHFLQRSNTLVFVVYRLVVGVGVLLVLATGVR